MCGIYAYLGPRNGVKIALDGLKRIEYRGYDSAGIGALVDGKIEFFKDVGKISSLEHVIGDLTSHAVVAHTRWATHGKVTKENAHPHLDDNQTVAVVLNGIIENFQPLKKSLLPKAQPFVQKLTPKCSHTSLQSCMKAIY